ncbi:hypothetical protein BGZ99_008938 [Dissophora globulifera]|uniref:Protein Lines C-terminal domain-containing protein n=1 Tax=Dissophora globulifera TaxID=979702 RepID=A0A9P6UYW7_9FUNG|nr:hypothetical protein BGZ99_008938 [Dissophora globulifera]
MALRKLLELLSLTLWKSTSTTGSLSMNEAASVANTAPQQLARQLKLPIQILALLSPIMLQVFISFRDTDPDLEQLLKVGTTFILCRAAEERPTGTNQTNGSHLIQSLLTNTEAMRQLGRVMLTATLSILETLGDLHDRQLYQDNPVSFDSESESDLASLLKVLQDILPELISFIRTWVGPGTIKTLLTVFGEDDSGFSWLLTVMIRIQLQLDKLRSQHMVNLGLCPPNSKNDNGVDTSSRPSTWRVLGGAFTYSEIIEDLYDHLHNHAHPLEMLFSFLETIGYDYQTFLDLLLTPDEKNESSGMLAAVMTVLRAFTERLPDQQRLLERWRQTIHGEDEDEDEGDIEAGKMLRENRHEDYADDEQDTDDGTDIDTDSDFTRGNALPLISTRAHLFNVDFCLSQLASRIRRLHQSNLFPYNPRPLLVVLDRTQNLLSVVVGE